MGSFLEIKSRRGALQLISSNYTRKCLIIGFCFMSSYYQSPLQAERKIGRKLEYSKSICTWIRIVNRDVQNYIFSRSSSLLPDNFFLYWSYIIRLDLESSDLDCPISLYNICSCLFFLNLDSFFSLHSVLKMHSWRTAKTMMQWLKTLQRSLDCL